MTLYVPAGVLKPSPDPNIVVFFELESSPSSRDPVAIDTIEFVDKPQINGHCFGMSAATRILIGKGVSSEAVELNAGFRDRL